MNDQPQSTATPASSTGPTLRDRALGVAGALLGAVVGHFICRWAAGIGFYAVAIPGMLAGVGTARFAPRVDVGVALTTGLIGLVAGVLTEWLLWPWLSDPSLGHFLANLHNLTPLTWILIALGAVFAYWFSFKPGRCC